MAIGVPDIAARLHVFWVSVCGMVRYLELIFLSVLDKVYHTLKQFCCGLNIGHMY